MVDSDPKPMPPALILVGGLGTRFRTVRDDIPKPLAPMAGRPVLEHMVLQLRHGGVRDIVFCVGHLASMIENHFGQGDGLGVRIKYAHERELLGTGGAIGNGAALIDSERFLAMNGDTLLTDLDFTDLMAAHGRNARADERTLGTLVVTPPPDPGEYGVVQADDRGRIEGFMEKVPINNPSTALISAGVYLLERRVLELIPGGRRVSVEFDVFPAALSRGDLLHAYKYRGFFGDMGTPQGYTRLGDQLEKTSTQWSLNQDDYSK